MDVIIVFAATICTTADAIKIIFAKSVKLLNKVSTVVNADDINKNQLLVWMIVIVATIVTTTTIQHLRKASRNILPWPIPLVKLTTSSISAHRQRQVRILATMMILLVVTKIIRINSYDSICVHSVMDRIVTNARQSFRVQNVVMRHARDVNRNAMVAVDPYHAWCATPKFATPVPSFSVTNATILNNVTNAINFTKTSL